MPERLKGMGCKPISVSLRWFESSPAQLFFYLTIFGYVVFISTVFQRESLEVMQFGENNLEILQI